MHRTKKLLLILTSLTVMFISVIPAYAETVYTDGYWKYTVDGGAVTITEYFGREENVTVPAMIAGRPVSVIAAGTFDGTPVKTILIPDTVMEIREGAIPGNASVSYYSAGAASEEPIQPAGENPEADKNIKGEEPDSSAGQTPQSDPKEDPDRTDETVPDITESEDVLTKEDIDAGNASEPSAEDDVRDARRFPAVWAAVIVTVCAAVFYALIRKHRKNS